MASVSTATSSSIFTGSTARTSFPAAPFFAAFAPAGVADAASAATVTATRNLFMGSLTCFPPVPRMVVDGFAGSGAFRPLSPGSGVSSLSTIVT